MSTKPTFENYRYKIHDSSIVPFYEYNSVVIFVDTLTGSFLWISRSRNLITRVLPTAKITLMLRSQKVLQANFIEKPKSRDNG